MSEEIPLRSTKSIPTTAQRRHYRIELRGQVDAVWMAPFDPTSFSISDRVTKFEVLADQAALRGLLTRLWDLNVSLISVQQIDPSGEGRHNASTE